MAVGGRQLTQSRNFRSCKCLPLFYFIRRCVTQRYHANANNIITITKVFTLSPQPWVRKTEYPAHSMHIFVCICAIFALSLLACHFASVARVCASVCVQFNAYNCVYMFVCECLFFTFCHIKSSNDDNDDTYLHRYTKGSWHTMLICLRRHFTVDRMLQ